MFPSLWRSSLTRWNGGDGASLEAFFSPAVDVVDTKADIRITAELPGLNKEDIQVAVDENVLTIKAEKKQESEKKEDGVIRSERLYGSFYRAFTLPATIDAAAIKANYKSGVLELTLPKKEESKPKQISVSIN